jgi:GT2 family glycosyltransferase
MHDLAVVIVTHDDAGMIERCLRSVLARAGDIRLQTVVVDNDSADGTADLVERAFPGVTVHRQANLGFGAGNNAGAALCDARYVLFLNPDTEILDGELAELVALLDERPAVGVAGLRELDPAGALRPSIRRFPAPLSALGDALAVERWPLLRRIGGERVLAPAAYEGEGPADWMSGSSLVLRAEALERIGGFDERYFLYFEETDLCLRARGAGYDVVHLPAVTILHDERERRGSPRLEAIRAQSLRRYAREHMRPARRAAYLAAVALRYALRAPLPGATGGAARSALAALARPGRAR